MSNGQLHNIQTRTIALKARPILFSGPLVGQAMTYSIAFLMAFFAADWLVLSLRAQMLPKQSPPVRPMNLALLPSTATGEYNLVVSRNLFSMTGDIPVPKNGNSGKEKEEIPMPSQLPLTIIGTIVHSNPTKSIVHLEIKGKNQSLAFAPQQDIDRLATVIRVERNRVVLRNLNNGRLEFVENTASGKLSFTASKVIQRPEGPANIRIVGENKYEIPKAEINRFTADMSNVVMQASTIPHRSANGEIDGFQITAIQPNSLFSQLGFLPSDVIKKANGEKIDSPSRAIELYNNLRSATSVKITVERDGREVEFEYSVKN